MDDINNLSRSNKFRKRRKLKRLMILLGLAAIIIIIILISLLIKRNEAEEIVSDKAEEEKTTEENERVEEDAPKEEDVDTFIDYVETTDENVLEAFVGNWEPIGTTQEGEHTTDYVDGSTDRKEIKKAVSLVTEIDEAELQEWRVENGGAQKVISTVSNRNEENIYRVYLSWVDEEGWQVTKVEKLKENDKK